MPSANNQTTKKTIASISPELGSAALTALRNYLIETDGEEPRNLYRMSIDAIEAPVLSHMLHLNGGNQSKTAEQLSMNRATLRTKLKRHGLI